ncbi:MAG: hypothetical protein U5Q44_06370 [Dehalococcoidia bacterium]|nr:hypothetical protein [Dehalococcoidia bacterium]
MWTLDGKTATASSNGPDCVYHIFLEKSWDGSDGPDAQVDDLLTATSYDVDGNAHDSVSCDWTGSALDCSSDLEVPANGTYEVDENLPEGWKNLSGLGTFDVQHGGLECGLDGLDKNCGHGVVNAQDDPEDITIIVDKVVCLDDSQVPENDAGGNRASDVDKSTASDWASQNDSCDVARGWEFVRQPGELQVASPTFDRLASSSPTA